MYPDVSDDTHFTAALGFHLILSPSPILQVWGYVAVKTDTCLKNSSAKLRFRKTVSKRANYFHKKSCALYDSFFLI